MKTWNKPTTDQEILERIEWSSALTRDEARRLLRLSTPCRISAGRNLTRQDTVGREAFLVLSGQARVEIDGRIVGQRGPGDFIGEMALLDHGQRCATVVADNDMEVLVFDPRAFSGAVLIGAIGRQLARDLAARNRALLVAAGRRTLPQALRQLP